MTDNIIILGAGMAGYGAAHTFNEAKIPVDLYEKNAYIGGRATSFTFDDKWVFDDGPHISFTKNEKVKKLFSENIKEDFHEFHANVNNYWKGKWIKHPAQTNLYGLPPEFTTQILKEMIVVNHQEEKDVKNYEDWLYATFGKTFADNFPKKYTAKFHTTEAKNLSTDWLGPRLYRPKLEEVIYGMVAAETPNVHYIKGFRYPNKGGFVSFMNGIHEIAPVQFNHEASRINIRKKEINFSNGTVRNFSNIVSSVPLPKIIGMIEDAPAEVSKAAEKLAWTQCVIVNLGIQRENVWDHHWTYFYDEDFQITRLSAPHLFSKGTVPPGTSSLQAEIYFSDKYKPLNQSPDYFIDIVHRELIKAGILRFNDEILIKNAWVSPFAQVIFDHDRKASVELILDYLASNNIESAGRYGRWEYIWTDESFMQGEEAAENILRKI